jgi:hypothetical protein
VILGIVIYFLIRRLYFKPFENLKDRLTSSNLDNTFLEEKTNRVKTAAIISSVASLIRNLRNEKAELFRTNEALKQAKDDLIKSERLSTVGKIAASIAHEVCRRLVTGTFPKIPIISMGYTEIPVKSNWHIFAPNWAPNCINQSYSFKYYTTFTTC